MFGQSTCISGSTILGNGDVALILDVPALINQAMEGVRSHALAFAV
jgi:two-component system chemotaxis sensor kinase CheA